MVDLKKIQTLDQLIPSQPRKVNQPDLGKMGPSFKDTLDSLGINKSHGISKPGLEGIKFSNHAIERMRTRGVSYSPEEITKISDAVSRAAAKGSKDSLILMNDSALIVSVKNNTVVTVMDKNALKENVFTNIDSTVVL